MVYVGVFIATEAGYGPQASGVYQAHLVSRGASFNQRLVLLK